MSARVGWNDYFMSIAVLVASRGTCDRLQVGCILVREKRILATGYNGAPAGVEHCDVTGHDLDEGGHCTRAVHAEANALFQCAAFGVPVEGATAYVTNLPCWRCYSALHQAMVRSIIYAGDYKDHLPERVIRTSTAPFAPSLLNLAALAAKDG